MNRVHFHLHFLALFSFFSGKFQDDILENDLTLFLVELSSSKLVAFSNSMIDGVSNFLFMSLIYFAADQRRSDPTDYRFSE